MGSQVSCRLSRVRTAPPLRRLNRNASRMPDISYCLRGDGVIMPHEHRLRGAGGGSGAVRAASTGEPSTAERVPVGEHAAFVPGRTTNGTTEPIHVTEIPAACRKAA